MDLRDPRRLSLELALHQTASLGLYIHVPFCRFRCPFCPFYVQIHRQKPVGQYLDALHRELGFYADRGTFYDVPVASVYVGGGTPSTLRTAELAELLAGIQKKFSLTVDAEISIEVHPGTVTGMDLQKLRRAGFNRLSLGMQSFDIGELHLLGGRIWGKGTYVMITEARRAGFQNINLDLMYGFPGHTLHAWHRTLDQAVSSSPEHLSCYAFTVEENTHVHDEVSSGRLPRPDEGFQLLLEGEAITRLSEFGYERYEISNFSRTGYACRHNMRYWQGEAYLGLGPSAQSYIGGVRFGNVADLRFYTQCLQESQLPLESWEAVPGNQIEREEVVFGLRLMKGVPIKNLSATMWSDATWIRSIHAMQQKGFLTIENGCFKLTPSGIQHADTVAVALL